MELTYLRTFCEVVTCGSYTRAAEKLGYAQSSITAQIAKLEEVYGAVLLERVGRGMTPTFAGKSLLPYARQMLALNEEVKEIISGGSKGILTISAIETLAAYFLPHRLHRYREQYPGIQLRVQPGSEVEIITAVKEKSADFGLIFDTRYVSEELESLVLRQEQLFIITHPEHPLAHQPELSLTQLAGEPLILTEDTCTYRRYLLDELKQAGISPRIDMEFGNLEGIKQAVKHQWGTAFLPGYAIEEERRQGSISAIPIVGDTKGFYIQLIYRKDRVLPPAYNDFIKQMQEL
ncbi:LysR family transcriptional regulator [Paenibacillus sp. 19GGS1-52]|uniref:LysR family transcriptional regulator n=1 Tax=Paenibacillus sp. 19GGS1-52 TaxID=2758563 RepID=UPI001EFBF641|nr:LysR family transcriptional regulator [Paenibacillus sp. 19GGS1-52]ULO07272.1 LysR family transcriptional regulator [Paenibacillus sp. 19GGS1-52]